MVQDVVDGGRRRVDGVRKAASWVHVVPRSLTTRLMLRGEAPPSVADGEGDARKGHGVDGARGASRRD